MRKSLASKFISVLVVYSLQICSSVFAQQRPLEETRPRRTQAEAKPPQVTKPVSSSRVTSPAVEDQWKPSPPSIIPIDGLHPSIAGAEPMMRIALATDVHSATVSTNAHLMSATDLAQTFVPLDVTRVRVESHLLSPLPQSPANESFRLKIAGLPSRAEADEQAKQLREATGDESQPVFDAETKTWGLLVGPRRSREDAEASQTRLEATGFDATVIDLSTPATAPSPMSLPGRTESSSSMPNSVRPITAAPA